MELDESYAQHLRIERQRKRRASSKEMINSPISSSPEAVCSPRKSYCSNAVVIDDANVVGGGEPSGGVSPPRIAGSIDTNIQKVLKALTLQLGLG